MQITAGVSKTSKTVQADLTFILNVLSKSSTILTVLLCVTMRERARALAATI